MTIPLEKVSLSPQKLPVALSSSPSHGKMVTGPILRSLEKAVIATISSEDRGHVTLGRQTPSVPLLLPEFVFFPLLLLLSLLRLGAGDTDVLSMDEHSMSIDFS